MEANQQSAVMQVQENLIATLPAHPTDSTIDELQDTVLTRINEDENGRVDGVVLDVTSVQTVDSFFARMIVETAQMVELMGAHPVLVGISPNIAITATELGFTLGDVDTALSTDAALSMLDAEEQ